MAKFNVLMTGKMKYSLNIQLVPRSKLLLSVTKIIPLTIYWK